MNLLDCSSLYFCSLDCLFA